jgi:histidine triad (HIT) family protein
VIAFLDVHPLMTGHTLVVPKQQVDHLWDLDTQTYEHLWSVVRQLGSHIKSTLSPARVGVVVEGFGVPHTHVHLIPIEHGEDLKRPQDLTGEIDHEALTKVAETLRVV